MQKKFDDIRNSRSLDMIENIVEEKENNIYDQLKNFIVQKN